MIKLNTEMFSSCNYFRYFCKNYNYDIVIEHTGGSLSFCVNFYHSKKDTPTIIFFDELGCIIKYCFIQNNLLHNHNGPAIVEYKKPKQNSFENYLASCGSLYHIAYCENGGYYVNGNRLSAQDFFLWKIKNEE